MKPTCAPNSASTLRLWILLVLFGVACLRSIAAECLGGLRIIAQTGTTVGGQTLTTIRPGVSINDRGSIAFAAIANGRSEVFAVLPDGTSKLLGGAGDFFYGVQINNNDDAAYLSGPALSPGLCIPDPDNEGQCLQDVDVAIQVFSVAIANALTSQSLPLASSIADYHNPFDIQPQGGPFVSLGPAFSLNNNRQVAFVGDVSTTSAQTDYRLATATLGSLSQRIPASPLSRPMIADNGRVVTKQAQTVDSPLQVWEQTLATPTSIADTASGFEWTGQYPGITDSGNRIAFTGRFTGSTSVFPTGDGLFLSTFVNGQWTNRLVLGTNHWGTNVFSRFHSYYRTCLADLSTRPNSVRICFGAASPTGNVGLYAVTYDYVLDEASSLTKLAEAGSEICDLGIPTSFELFDAVNDHGEVVFWVQTNHGDAVVRAGREIEAIDPVPGAPLPNLVDVNGRIITDLARLAAAPDKVQGLTADGVTRVLLRVETPGPGQATFAVEDESGGSASVGLLSSLISPNEATSVQVQAQSLGGGRFMAFAVLKSPLDFVRTGMGDESRTNRTVKITVQFQAQGSGITEAIARGQLRLYRPPVVLMHGIWSGRDTWKWPLAGNTGFFVYTNDYSSSHAEHFAVNISQAQAAVDAALREIRKHFEIAAVQADFVGHSMGGILGRLYVASGTGPNAPISTVRYLRSDNYSKGDIHKLITLDTPHKGSEVCNLVMDQNGQKTKLGTRINYAKPVDRGAVADFRTDSEPITQLPAARVPSHAIISVGGPITLSLVDSSLVDLEQFPADSFVRELITEFYFSSVNVSNVFLFQPHDLIVSESSQKGGLAPPQVSTFDYQNPLNPAVHTTVTAETTIGQHVRDLLNVPVIQTPPIPDLAFAQDGFPANSPAPSPPAPSPRFAPAGEPPPPPAFVQGLNITNPVSGTNVPAGASVSVTVAATNGFQPAKVLLIGPWGADLDEAAPFALTVNVPTNWIGPLAVKAFGVDTNGIFAEAPEIVLNVNTTATLTNLALRPDTIYLFDYAQTRQVEVFGQFSDGVERKLASPMFDLRHLVIDSAIATVSSNGLVQAVRSGNTTLSVRVGAFHTSAPVLVLGAPFTNDPPQLSNQLEVVDLGPASAVANLYRLNNAGQVLLDRQGVSGLWQYGMFTPLAIPPGANVISPRALSESGVVAGGAGISGGPTVNALGMLLWTTPSNHTWITFPDGTRPTSGYFVDDIQDSDTGLIGMIGSSQVSGIGTFSSSLFRLQGTNIGPQSIPLSGVPAEYSFYGASRINRSGAIAGHLVKIQGDTIVSQLAGGINATNRVTAFPEEGGYATDLNDSGEVVGYSPGNALRWRDGNTSVLWSGEGSQAIAINSRGHVAVYRSPILPLSGAGIWADGRVVRLDELFAGSEWRDFNSIVDLNDNGWVLARADSTLLGNRAVIVKLAPRIAVQPVSRTKVPGQSVTFSIQDYSFGARYRWRKNGLEMQDGPRIIGSAMANFTIESLQASDAAVYDVVLSDAYGSTISSNAVLTVLAMDCLPAPSGQVAQWTGDQTEQEMLNRFNGHLSNGAGYSNGLCHSAFQMDGTNDYITTDLDVSPAAMPSTTWEAWVYPTRLGHPDDQDILSCEDGGNMSFRISNDRSIFIKGSGWNYFSVGTGFGSEWNVTPVMANEWQHIAVVYSPTNIEFYRNGIRFAYGGPPGNQSTILPFNLGRSPNQGRYFRGLIDEVGVYNRALTQTEIQTIYDVGSASKCRPQQPPAINLELLDQVVYAGGNAPFTTAAQGTAPLTLYWYFNRTNGVVDANAQNLTVTNAQADNGGLYSVVASNAFGSATSRVATLTVRPICETGWVLKNSRINPWQNRPSVAFDSRRGVVVAYASGTWEWNGSQWTSLSPNFPPSRDQPAMAYDSARGVTLLFGGYSPGGLLNDTWEWDGTKWTQVASGGPPPRGGSSMAYDSKRGVVVLFGGNIDPCGTGCYTSQNDTWEWDGIEWQRVESSLSPPARHDHEMVYDAQRERIVLFGGAGGPLLNDTWEWDGVSWQPLLTLQSPPPRQQFGMAYSSSRKSLVLFGGNGAPNDTWELVGNSWVQVPIAGPGPFAWARVVNDSIRDALVIVDLRQTWEWTSPKLPVFAQQPQSRTLYVGNTDSLFGCAQGSGELRYQWFLNGTNAIAAQSVLFFNPVQAAHAGRYTLVVSNAFGSVTSVVASLTVLPCQFAPTGMVAWWRGEGDARDGFGTNHGMLLNGAGFAVGKVGQAFQFDGVDDHVRITSATNLFLREAAGFTIEGWIQPHDWQVRPLVEWNGGSNANTSVGVHLWTSVATNGGPGSLFANIRRTNATDNILATGPSLLDTNGWQHVALTYNRTLGAAVLFLNGSVVATQSVGSFRTATTTDVYLGARPGTTNIFAGLMDEITIYNRALTAAEIASIAAAGSAGKCAEPDGTPYVYVNGIRAVEDPFTVLSDTPAQATLLSTFPNGTVRYTMDGSVPSNGVLYAGPFALSEPASVRAIAFTTNGTPSQPVARTIRRLPTSAVSPNHLGIVSHDGSGLTLILRGTANHRYVLERSANLDTWTTISSTVASLDGVARMKDTNPLIGQAFYRAVEK